MLFKEAAASANDSQVIMVDAVTKGNPLLEVMEVFPANNNLQHSYEKVTGIDGAKLRELNATPTKVDTRSSIERMSLQIISGKHFVTQDAVQQVAKGDLNAYLDRKLPKILAATGNSVEEQMIYDYWRALAIASKKAQSAQTTPTGSDKFSIIALRFEEDECGMLFNENQFEAGNLLNVTALNGGALTRDADGRAGYDFELTAYATPFAATDQHYATIVNIDATHVPTKTMINDMISDVYPQKGGRVVLVMSPFVQSLLETAHGNTPFRTANKTDDFGQMPTLWYNTPIIATHQMKRASEASVTLS